MPLEDQNMESDTHVLCSSAKQESIAAEQRL